ncbi:hypothetical protein EP56_05825 [Listeriaceae bacterium FSL A5-0209]|nr:hypothetical protein EP56_05825 [Listeriaceae bacterium FSL A5-0209]
MASKNVANIYVNPTMDNFLKSAGGVKIAFENKNKFDVESKVKVEKYNETKKAWETACVLQGSEGALSANSRQVEELLNNHFFKKGVGKYRVYYEFYKAGTPIPYFSKLGSLTTSVFTIK